MNRTSLSAAQAQWLSVPLAGLSGSAAGYLFYDNWQAGLIAGVGFSAMRGYFALSDYGTKPKRRSAFQSTHHFDMSVGSFEIGFNLPFTAKKQINTNKPVVVYDEPVFPGADYDLPERVMKLFVIECHNDNRRGLSSRKWEQGKGYDFPDWWSAQYYQVAVHWLRFAHNSLRLPLLVETDNGWLRLGLTPGRTMRHLCILRDAHGVRNGHK